MRFFNLKNCGWLFLALLSILGFYYVLFLNNFDSHPITSELPYHPEWEISTPDSATLAKINQILEQPFIYLDEGGQSYVFSSTDQKYVLKLFKFKRFRPSFLIKILPPIFPFKSYREQHIAKREKKLMTAFNGYKLAYDLHQHASGLIFIQLNPSNQSKWIILVDKGGRQRKLNLAKVSYVLQERGEMLSTDLSRILQQGNLSIAKQRIDQVFDLYLSEYHKGIYDLDHGVMHNIGCIRNRLFHLDVGKLVADEKMKEPEFYQKDLIKIAAKLQRWISWQYPQYAQELIKYMEEKLSHILCKNFEFAL
jgi:hypothetical protein